MNIITERNDHTHLMRLSGNLDALTCNSLEEKLRGELDSGAQNLVLDMEAVPYISSAGLRVILLAKQAMAEEGRLAITRPGQSVRQILELAGFHHFLEIHEQLEAALTDEVVS